MKNEIQLKEELLVLEAQYAALINRSTRDVCKYVKGKSQVSRARELNYTIVRCKLQIEALQRTKDINNEIKLLKSMRQNMAEAMSGAESVPAVFAERMKLLDSQIEDLESQFNELVTKC